MGEKNKEKGKQGRNKESRKERREKVKQLEINRGRERNKRKR